MKKKSKFPLFFLLFLIIVSNAANYWYFNIYCEGIYKEKTEELQLELNSYQTQVYIANVSIPAGTAVTADMVTECIGYVSSKTGLFHASDLGKTAIATIPAGAILASNMVYDESVEAGNTSQYDSIKFPDTAIEGHYVDIRIRFKNGNDYIVISKTKLTGIFGSSSSLLTLTEEERQYLSSALVDGQIYSAEIYATIYSSPETQPPAIVTYIPRLENLPLIYSGDELITYEKARKVLEPQLNTLSEEMRKTYEY